MLDVEKPTHEEDVMRSALFALSTLVLAAFFAGGCATGPSAGPGAHPATLAAPASPSGITGTVQIKDAALEGVFVSAYTSPAGFLRGPTKLISPATAADGSYTLNLAPGTYYVVARKRANGEPTGNMVKGDLEGRAAQAVTVKPGELTRVDLSVAPMPGSYLLAPYAHTEGDYRITGKVVKEDGSPFSDAYVQVYTRRDRIGKPTYLSKPTNEHGEYTICVNKPGVYYIAARSAYGNLPRKGEAYGTYDIDPDHKVEITGKGVVTGIDIPMRKFTRDLTKCAEH